MTIAYTYQPDPILLSLFSNRFMSVAEAMGRSLQQTSISTNIKERLDYSCALFGPEGDLVANAPFIPVHLGSMSHCVKYQLAKHGPTLKPGDVILSNSPNSFGSHLPDLTAVTPVFDQGKIIFFTASRAHHADIGGIIAGSMPSNSKMLHEEGAEILSFKVVSQGVFDAKGLYKLLVEDPAQYPGCSGCRNYGDVESDLKAQIAANHKGATLLSKLVQEYSLPVVHSYMRFIRDNAATAVRQLLRDAADKVGGTTLKAVDYMDDGTPIHLTVEIDKELGNARFDFTGTGPQIYGNLNTPVSVVHSAIIYCMRAMVGEDIPLNAGCLVPLDIYIPEDCFLNPGPTAAVCAGNVLTSQRITDTVLKAFGACAASQGCCNNLSFGAGGKDPVTGEVRKGWGYYETIAGGSGAGPSWDGASGVHCHMTNTRITDPEILERRYPVILHQFGYRPNSGGDGAFVGGNGVIREMEFLEPITVSLLTERRARAPYGAAGGADGSMGRNIWIPSAAGAQSHSRQVNIGGKATVPMTEGDRLIIETPGGGGWGVKGQRGEVKPVAVSKTFEARGSVAERTSAENAF